MRWRRFLFALAVPSAALSAALAKAAEHAEFALDFGGAPGCPSEKAFEEALQARLPEARRVPESSFVPLLRVRLNVGSGQSRSLWLLLPDGTGVQREVSDAACSDAVQSMAVISAIALEASQRRAAELDGATSISAPRGTGSAQSEPAPMALPTPVVSSTSSPAVARCAGLCEPAERPARPAHTGSPTKGYATPPALPAAKQARSDDAVRGGSGENRAENSTMPRARSATKAAGS
ncbi:MAG: hypothetical protein ABJB12_11015 [Pseudomonadota bacterium]